MASKRKAVEKSRVGKCTGTAKTTGKPCEAWAIRGGTVCVKHGGAAPQVKAAAARRAKEAAAKSAVVLYGLPVEVDPHTALLDELWRTAGHVAWLRAQIAGLEDAALHGPVGGETHPREEPHVWVRLYQEERRHLALVARDCIRAGIEERRVTLAEQQGVLIADAFRAFAVALGHDPASREVKEAARAQLTLIAGGLAG